MRTAVLLTLVASASARKVSLRAVTNPRESNIVINSRATSLVYDDVHYVMDIGVGKYDVHWYTLLVDTGSEQTFFGTSPRQPYIGSASQSKTTATWTQAFVSGDYYSGLWARDQTTIAPGLVLGSTDFGIVTKIAPGSATLLETGVFALAPQAGLEQKVGSDRFSTWMTAAADAGVVPQNIVTIDLGEPSLTFGHVDLENAVGTPVYLSCLEAERWLVKISAPLFVLTTADMQKMIQRIPGSKILEGSRILQIPSDHIPMDLTFEIGNLKFVLPGEKQLLGAPTRRDFHGLVFSIFQQIDTMPDGAGAIMGSKVLQHLIAVFDDDNQRIGFAARK